MKIAYNNPIVSVVVPAYNAERTIGDAIRSVLAGTFQEFELIICNDASTDRTVEVVNAFQDTKIRLIHNAVNSGEGVTRDRAIEAASGQWVAPLDADDLFEPDRLKVLMETATAHPTAIVFDEIMECHDTPGGIVRWKPVDRGHTMGADTSAVLKIELTDWMVWKRTLVKPLIPTALIRNHAVHHTDRRFSADLEFLLNLLARSKAELWFLPRPMYLYRLSTGSMSTTASRHSLLAETIENAIPLFADNPSAVDVLRCKAADTHRGKEYQEFFSSMMSGRLRAASRMALNKPWVIPEFLRRSTERIPYHISRLWHGGNRRKTT